MKKSQAIHIWGEQAVELARDYYETDFGKVLFLEDCDFSEDCPACEEDQFERCSRAYFNLTGNVRSGIQELEKLNRRGNLIKRKFQDTNINLEYWVVSCVAKENKEFYSYKDSYNFITVFAGFDRGMTDSGYACWTTGIPTLFNSLDDAKEKVKYFSNKIWNADVYNETVRFYKVKRNSVVTFDIEECL